MKKLFQLILLVILSIAFSGCSSKIPDQDKVIILPEDPGFLFEVTSLPPADSIVWRLDGKVLEAEGESYEYFRLEADGPDDHRLTADVTNAFGTTSHSWRVLEAEVETCIGQDGGAIEIINSESDILGTKIDIPEGALSEETCITLTHVNLSEGLAVATSGSSVDFGPDGTIFDPPAKITRPYKEDDTFPGTVAGTGVAEGDLEVKYFDEQTQKWVNYGGVSVNTEHNFVEYNTTHFTENATTVSIFIEFQSFPSIGGIDWEFYTIGSGKYLALSSHMEYPIQFSKWNGSIFQSQIDTGIGGGIADLEILPIASDDVWVGVSMSGGYAVAKFEEISGAPGEYSLNPASPTTQFLAFNGYPAFSRFYTIDDGYYIAIPDAYGNKTKTTAIFKRDNSTFLYEEYQLIDANFSWRCEEFKIDGTSYLAVANQGNWAVVYPDIPDGNSDTESSIYRWDTSLIPPKYVHQQSINTKAAWDFESFTIDGNTYLAVANNGKIDPTEARGFTPVVNSEIYKWNDSAHEFELVDTIETNGATDLDSFVKNDEVYLCIANSVDLWHNICNNGGVLPPQGYTNATYSKVYRWDWIEDELKFGFVHVDSLETKGAIRLEYFSFLDNGSERSFLAVAEYVDGLSYETNSTIYELNLEDL